MSGADTWSILFVCTGNVCRSPMAERLTRGALEARLGPAASAFHVASAGTHGLEGHPMEPHARRTLRELGADPDGFLARRLTERMVDDADLVLCATRAHRADVVTMTPRALKRSFTIREFARLTAGLDPDDIRGATLAETGARLARRAIGGRLPAHPADDDILDPYLRGLDDFRHCAALIADGLRGPVDLLAAASPYAHPADAEHR